ncbi:MAG: ABC-F family ATP-binding cassette domain-containing protein [Myxococcales bacterium]|nr:ABC-F family ATP-binding cassette domain-containing protein [Myxococcales bacterium]
MTILQVDHVSFSYGADTVFEDVSFALALGEKVALVAPNGQGKSTLLKLIAGELTPDEGRVLVPKGTRVSYLHQSHEPDPDGTVLDALLATFVEAREARHRLTAAEEAAASGTEAALERLASAQDYFARTGADAIEREVSAIAHQVRFTDADLHRRVGSLSGGERGRLQLAVVLASKPDLLLLDEPTNHLDLETVYWLEGFIRTFRGAVIIVSHDRAFLDATCPRTCELGMFSFRDYPLSYSKYVDAREVDLERERKAVMEQREYIAKTEEYIRRNIAGQNTKIAQGRRKMLEKLERLDNPEDIWSSARKLGMRFAPARRSGDIVIEAKGLRAERGGRVLFDGVDLLIKRLDRVAIVGPNGAGKSTLLKLLAGKGDPSDKGDVRQGTNLDVGYFDQHLESLDPEKSCVEIIRGARPDMVVDAVRQYLARFRFYGDDPFRAVRSLSGGERTRLALAKLLLVPRNVLLLDEPTNHLDIPACEILEEALSHFDGTVLLVSHDRYFLERVATRLVHLDRGNVTLYSGSWSDYVSHREKLDAASKPVVEERNAKRPAVEAPKAPSKGRESYEDAKRKTREAEKRARRIADLEKLIADGEAKLADLRAQLKDSPGSDWEKIAELAEKEQELVRRVDGFTEEWMKLSEESPS